MCEVRVGCDETGIWREDQPGARMHVPWAEITRVSAGKLDCITRVDTVLEFDHESGHYLEIYDTWDGYQELVIAVGRQYSLPDDWYLEVERLGAQQDPIVIWQRDDYPD